MASSNYHHPAVRCPTVGDLQDSAKNLGLTLSDEELHEHQGEWYIYKLLSFASLSMILCQYFKLFSVWYIDAETTMQNW